MAFLLQWVKKLAVFMILSGYMEHLLPSGYRRYFHMCTGLILILMISSPLSRVLNGSMSSDFAYLLEDFRTGSEVYQFDSEAAKNYQVYYMQQYRKAVEAQISQIALENGLTVRSMDFEVDEEKGSNRYGCLENLTVTVEADRTDKMTENGLEDFKKSLAGQLGLAAGRLEVQTE